MGGPSGGQGGGRTDAGPNRTTATKIGVGNINEKGKKTRSYKSDNPDAFRNRGAEKIKKGVKKTTLRPQRGIENRGSLFVLLWST